MSLRESDPISEGASDEIAGMVAIVIPVFKHSALVREAIASVRTASSQGHAQIVIVDDGCPHFQTIFSGMAAACGNTHYIRQINRGLSGARNCGIDFVLEHLPECEAIYFLDADNRLSSFSIARFKSVLASNPDSDWFYPDIRMIGIPWLGDFSGPFRCLTQTLMNICEAGSLVRRRVFESGLRFDEGMRAGYEDWEFWISLMERGFRGEHLPASGFLYRKRAESMLADSNRRQNEIIQYIRAKHLWMRDINTLVALEHREAPRFAVVCSDSGTVLAGSDPKWAREYSKAEYDQLLTSSLERPNWMSAGAILVFTSKAVLRQLGDANILHSLFWRAEIELRRHNFVSVKISGCERQYLEQRNASASAESDIVFMRMTLMRAILFDEKDEWIAQIVDAPGAINGSSLEVLSPTFHDPAMLLRAQRRNLYEFARRVRLCGPPILWSGRPAAKHEGTPDLTLHADRLNEMFGHGNLPCRLADTDRPAGMVLPVVEFGGVEKVAFRIACEFKRRGFRVDLIVHGAKGASLYDAHVDGYDQIYIADHASTSFGGPAYDGTYLPNNTADHHPEMTNLLLSYEVVINCHAAGILCEMSKLRSAGVVTVNHVHLLEYTKMGLATGHPIMGLAFEHSIDITACCSRQMAALGVPREKIVEVPNGPGTRLTRDDVSAASARRASRADDHALRVLYLGRLDPQKGLDRLNEIVTVLRGDPDRFDVRVVGGRVIMDDDGEMTADLRAEPPVYSDEDIKDLYQWSDVIIMPSRFEGLPLTIIEAMMLGVVPIVTDVGAVSEVVTHGETGYIVSGARIAGQMIDLIRDLAANRDTLRRLSENALGAAETRDWTLGTAALIDRVEALRRQRSKARKSVTDFHVLKQPMTSPL